MYDGPFASLQQEMQYLMTMDEVYFGKTQSIAAIEQQLDLCRKKYIGTRLMPNQDSDFMKLNHMIEDQFGFGNFCLYVTFDPIAAAATMPIEFNLSIDKKDNNYIVDAHSYRFKKEYNYTCMVIMTTGLIFNPEFTTEEIMACLLYELGQNFYSCFSHSNAILSNVYSITSIASAIADAVQLYLGLSGAAQKQIDAGQAKAAQNMTNADLASNPDVQNALRVTSPEKVAEYIKSNNQANLNKIKSNDPYPSKVKNWVNGLFAGGILANFVVSPLYLKLQKTLREKFSTNSAVQSSMISLWNYITLAGKYVLNNIVSLYDLSARFLSGTLFKAMTIVDCIVPLKSFITLAKNPMSWLSQPVNFKVEQAANNFPTMYGYSAAMVSYFEKMKTTKKVEWLSHFVKNNPFIGVMYDTLLLPSKIIFSVFDSNPHNISRCHDQIKLLEAELNKQNLPPKMRTTIMKDIQACKDQIKKLTDISRGVDDPDIAKKLFSKALEDFFGGIGLRERLFSSKSRFEEYDANVKSKMAESGIELPAHEDCWYVPMNESTEIDEYVLEAKHSMMYNAMFAFADFLTKVTTPIRNIANQYHKSKLYDKASRLFEKDFRDKTPNLEKLLAQTNGEITLRKKSWLDVWNADLASALDCYTFNAASISNHSFKIAEKIVAEAKASGMCTAEIVVEPKLDFGLIVIVPKADVFKKYLNQAKLDKTNESAEVEAYVEQTQIDSTNECIIAMAEYLEPSTTL